VTFGERFAATSYRGPGFDLIRLAAATTVLLHHSRGIEYPDIRLDPLFHFSGGFIHFGILAVMVFFVMSGFLVTPGLARSGDIIDYAVNRALRIFPALFTVVLFSALLLGPLLTTQSLSAYFSNPRLYLYFKNVVTSYDDFLPGVVLDGQPAIINGSLWTLQFEVLSYVMLALACLLGLLRRKGIFLLLWATSYSMYVGLNFAPGVSDLLPGRLVTLNNLFVYFIGGSAFFLFRDRIPFSLANALTALSAMALALPVGLGPLVVPIGLPYLVTYCGLSDLPGRAMMSHDPSYGVYLIHAPILCALMLFFPSLKVWWAAAMIVFFIALALSYMSWTFVEGPALRRKKTVSRWLHSRLAANRGPNAAEKPEGGNLVVKNRIGLEKIGIPTAEAENT
jgi:peptidoglycan/LPS O-acetylase OafA/YrhL